MGSHQFKLSWIQVWKELTKHLQNVQVPRSQNNSHQSAGSGEAKHDGFAKSIRDLEIVLCWTLMVEMGHLAGDRVST